MNGAEDQLAGWVERNNVLLGDRHSSRAGKVNSSFRLSVKFYLLSCFSFETNQRLR
jgi:hypothetical protein